MSEIPFYFHSPSPRYFRDTGIFKNPKNKAFIDWCFERCSHEERVIFHDNQKITLKPYQFIFGRPVCVEETGLTEDEVRTQQKRWESCGFLKKAPNKTPNRFTIYEWVLTAFLKDSPQQNPRSTPNKPPTNPHNQEGKNDRTKKDHHPYPSSKTSQHGDDDHDSVTDDFSSNKAKGNENKTEVYPGVFLNKEDLEACIAVKGNIESVKHAVEYILRHPGRKRKIYNWPSTLAKWEIKQDMKPKLKENEEMGKRLEKEFNSYAGIQKHGWKCEVHHDKKKDQKGILFFNDTPTGNSQPIFIPFIDPEFKEKCTKALRDNNMQRGRIS